MFLTWYIIGMIPATIILYFFKFERFLDIKRQVQKGGYISDMYRRDYETWSWFPTPFNIGFILLASFFGPVGFFIVVIYGFAILISLFLRYRNGEIADDFFTWLDTPLFKRKK